MTNTNGYEKKIESLIAECDELRAEVSRMEAEELKLHASLAESVLHAQSGWARYENSNNLVKGYQVELAQAKKDFKILQGHFCITVLERNDLSDKLAALEAQEPVAEKVNYPDMHMVGPDDGGYTTIHEHQPIPIGTKLYLAAGAKEKP